MRRRAILLAALAAMACTSITEADAEQRRSGDPPPAAGPDAPADARVARFNAELARLQDLWKAGDHQAAIAPAERLAALAFEIHGANHTTYTGMLFNVGLLYRSTRRPDAAYAVFAKAFDIERTLRQPTDPAYQRLLGELSDAAQQAGQGRAAVGHFETALEQLASESGLGTAHEVFFKARFGRLLRFLADYERAELMLREALAVRRRIATADDVAIIHDINNLAGIVRARGKYGEAATLYREAIDTQIRLVGEDNANTGILLDNLAVMYLTMGEPHEAEPHQKRALAILEKTLGPEHRSTGIALGNMAELYRNLGRFQESGQLFERALAVLEKALPANHPLLGVVTDNYAGLLRQRRQYDKAYDAYRKAVALLTAAHGPDHPEVAVAVNNIGLALAALGRTEEAEASHLRALALGRRAFGEDSIKLAATLGNLADVRILLGKYEEARANAERAIALITQSLGPTHRRLVFPLTRVGEIDLRQGRTAEGYAHLLRAARIYETTRSTSAARSDGHDDSGALERVIDAAFELRGKGGQPPPAALTATAFQFSQIRGETSAAAALNKLGARLGARDPALRDLAREHQDITEAWARADKDLITAVSDAPARRDKAREALLRSEIQAFTARLAEIGERLARDYPEFSELSRPRPLAVGDVRTLLAPDEVLVQFLATPSRLYTWAVTRDAVHWVRTPVRLGELRKLVNALRCGLDIAEWVGEQKPLACFELTGRFADGARLPFPTGKAHDLYRTLFGPLEEVIAGRKLLVVPSDALNRVPMHVLLTAPVADDGLATLRTAPWLARRHAITVLPSVSSLAILRRAAATRHPPSTPTGAGPAHKPYLALANPLLLGPSGADRSAFSVTGCSTPALAPPRLAVSNTVGLETYFRGGAGDVARLRALEPLPDTATEVCAVARDLGATTEHVLLGEAATETRLRALDDEAGRLARYRILHFATHGLVAGEVRGIGEPALVLTPPESPGPADDGVLTASEVAELRLDADWVILSACNTAAGAGENEAGGEALSGLARAFFFAGARALLVSHWPVRSDAAVALTTRALRLIARNPALSRSEALRHAMLALIDDDAMDAAAHPQVWAPFVVVGDG